MYEKFYNLSARPFQLMPDPRMLFESADHKRALAYLLYGLERREGIVVITGGVGMGKTLLVQTLLGEMRTRPQSVARIAMANLDASSVLPTVASAFGLPHKSRSKIELLDELVTRALRVQAQGALLIVDEAQSCTDEALEELRAISNLQANGRALLQIFLVGQTDLRENLARPQMAHLRQRIVASHHLSPLDADEVRAYIEHRLGVVGWRDNPHFENGVSDLAHEWSRGVPRRVNLLMDRFLLYGYLEDRTELTVDDLRVVINEFEQEFESDDLALAAEAPPAPGAGGGAPSDVDLAELDERMRCLEQGLIAALGDKRAAQLIHTHQAEAQNREVVAAQMRIARIERLFNGWVNKSEATKAHAAPDQQAHATADSQAQPPATEHEAATNATAAEPAAEPLSDADKSAAASEPPPAEDEQAEPAEEKAQAGTQAAKPRPDSADRERKTPYLEPEEDLPRPATARAQAAKDADVAEPRAPGQTNGREVTSAATAHSDIFAHRASEYGQPGWRPRHGDTMQPAAPTGYTEPPAPEPHEPAVNNDDPAPEATPTEQPAAHASDTASGAREPAPDDKRPSLAEAVDAIAPGDLAADRKAGGRNTNPRNPNRRLFSRLRQGK